MMPKVSVIVPVYKVELYLRKCLNSILAQTYQNLEIILVDDGSPDQCGKICDEYAKRDSRIIVIHKENGGLSSARNAALDICTGDYIGFVDSDDYIKNDMYEYLVEGALKYQKDISVCEYYNVYEDKVVNKRREYDDVFDTKDAMKHLFRLRIGNYAWNKLYARKLWEGIRYPVGKNYEDVLTTYRLFEASNGCVALKDPKYYYLDNSFGIVKNPSVKNAVACVWARMERFIAVHDRYPASEQTLLQEIYRYTESLYRVVMNKDQSEFETNIEALEPVCQFLGEYYERMAEASNLGRLWKYELKLLSNPTYSYWKRVSHLEILRNWRDYLRDFKRKVERKYKVKLGKRDEIEQYYQFYQKFPIDEQAVLVESRGGEDFASNIYYIVRALADKGMKVYLSVYKDKTERPKRLLSLEQFPEVEFVFKPSKEYYKAFATSKYFFNDMVYNEKIMKREGQIWVNVWHGTPLKNLEYDIVNQRHGLGGTAREFLSCDYLVAPSDFMLGKLVSSAHLGELLPRVNTKMICSGYPRNEVFYNTQSRETIRESLGLGDKEVFIYMPTWRGALFNSDEILGTYSIDKIMNFFESNLNENQIVFVKLHNLAAAEIDFEKYQKVLPFPAEFEPYCFLNVADCLITDYSSVFFDFSNTRKKIVLFAYDKKEYLSDRGLYLPMESLPFPIVETYDELKKELNTVKCYDDSKFVEEYCSYDCEDAAEKLVNQVVFGEELCETKTFASNNKKNVLIYDARISWRADKVDPVIDRFRALDDKCNYFYAFRARALKASPVYLQNLPENVQIYSLPNWTALTLKEKRRWDKTHTMSEKTAAREFKRAFPGMPFDEIDIIEDNEFDPYAFILRNYRSNH